MGLSWAIPVSSMLDILDMDSIVSWACYVVETKVIGGGFGGADLPNLQQHHHHPNSLIVTLFSIELVW